MRACVRRGEVAFVSDSSGRTTRAHAIKLKLHSRGRAGGHLLLLGRREGEVRDQGGGGGRPRRRRRLGRYRTPHHPIAAAHILI